MQVFADIVCFPTSVRRLTRCNIPCGDYNNCYVVKLLNLLHSSFQLVGQISQLCEEDIIPESCTHTISASRMH